MPRKPSRKLAFVKEAETDFLDMVAHQLRGPLGGIRASASMLADGDYGKLPVKAKQAAALIEDSATRLLSLADSFLNASRLEVGMYESVHELADVHHEIMTVVEEMKSAASAKRLKLTSHLDVPSRKVSLDLEALRQTVFNLLDNAIKYTDAGSVTLHATIQGKRLRITVSDTGVGMSQSEMRELFKKFHRGKSGHEKSIDGTGLGLFIVKHLVEAAGGSIEPKSAGAYKGSEFTAWLPFRAS